MHAHTSAQPRVCLCVVYISVLILTLRVALADGEFQRKGGIAEHSKQQPSIADPPPRERPRVRLETALMEAAAAET